MSAHPETYVVPYELMRRLWATIDHYGNEFTYRGERTGGVLQGCPRGPDPTPEQLTVEAAQMMKQLTEWRDKNYPVQP
jgi:hypothetical protein